MKTEVAAAPNRSHAFALALFEELARSGLRDVCVCPGSRSAPLAVAAATHGELRTWSHIDERSAAFFALGKAMRRALLWRSSAPRAPQQRTSIPP